MPFAYFTMSPRATVCRLHNVPLRHGVAYFTMSLSPDLAQKWGLTEFSGISLVSAPSNLNHSPVVVPANEVLKANDPGSPELQQMDLG